MTPTEQDKELREQVEGIFKNPHCESCHEDWDYDSSYRTDSCCTRFMTDSISKVVGLIAADRKRVALEARVAELEKFVNTTNRSLSVKKLRDRLSELKAQQEANQQASKAKQEEA